MLVTIAYAQIIPHRCPPVRCTILSSVGSDAERILGDSDFVDAVLKQNEEVYERRIQLKSKGVDLDALAQRVSQLLDMPTEQVWSKGKYWHIVAARSLLCFWAVRELGMSATSLAPKFGVSAAAISKSVVRGEKMARENNFEIEEF